MRIALVIEYNGTNYHGWQKQENIATTIQETLEDALSQLTSEKINVFCAGRTDVGVHALAQVVHFDTQAKRPLVAFKKGTNFYLPPDIRVKKAFIVPTNFDARKSAYKRCYRYFIYNAKTRSAILNKLTTWYLPKLDIKRMQEAAKFLIGEHDFSSFRGALCQAKTPFRNVMEINIYAKEPPIIVIEVIANAFLLHMVRNIAGMLMEIGAGKKEITFAKEVLEARDRRLNSPTAPAEGLYLTKIYYPENLHIEE